MQGVAACLETTEVSDRDVVGPGTDRLADPKVKIEAKEIAVIIAGNN